MPGCTLLPFSDPHTRGGFPNLSDHCSAWSQVPFSSNRSWSRSQLTITPMLLGFRSWDWKQDGCIHGNISLVIIFLWKTLTNMPGWNWGCTTRRSTTATRRLDVWWVYPRSQCRPCPQERTEKVARRFSKLGHPRTVVCWVVTCFYSNCSFGSEPTPFTCS